MKSLIPVVVAGALLVGAPLAAQDPQPFKLGTFERAGQSFVGVVLRDALVIDFAAAHAALSSAASGLEAPEDMKDLIARYDDGLRASIEEVVRAVDEASSRRYTSTTCLP